MTHLPPLSHIRNLFCLRVILQLLAVGAAVFCSLLTAAAQEKRAPECGNTEANFAAWRQAIYTQAAASGIGAKGLSALKATHYAHATIAADRNQSSFKLSLEQFLRKRGADGIISRGRALKQQHAQLFAALEQRYGVPPGVLLAIWGLETGFGNHMGKQNTLAAVATLAYDCRRSEFFTQQLYAALQLIEKGDLQAQSVGAMHGEIGQTQFLPLNVLRFGVDGDNDGKIDLIGSAADALSSTANFLAKHGWRRGRSYQQGDSNFSVIASWNKASVYQKAIAAIAERIDSP